MDLCHWQELYFGSIRGDPREKADSLRGMAFSIAETRAGRTRNDLSQTYSSCLRQYSIAIDATDRSRGMDNFAEAVLSQLENKANESQQWSSRLNLESVKRMQEVKDVEKATQDKTITLSKGGRFPQKRGPDLNSPVTQTCNTRDRESPRRGGKGGHFSWGTKRSSRSDENTPEIKNEAKVSWEKKKDPSLQEDEDVFVTAKQQLAVDQKKSLQQHRYGTDEYSGRSRRQLGTRRTPFSKFTPPTCVKQNEEPCHRNDRISQTSSSGETPSPLLNDDRLKNLDQKMIGLIMNEIVDHSAPVSWEHIAGLEFAKATIKEAVIWPMLRPDLFTGLRGPPKGILLFGPPGTGKTLIGKCIASQAGATFFSISASSLTSKWVGEGEKMVRTLFAVAQCFQPAVIFIDEIDSLLTQRNDTEHESSRRIKTEFLVQLVLMVYQFEPVIYTDFQDGATTNSEDRVLVVGATNRPQEIDEAARRRLSKRLYIPLPDGSARKQIISSLLAKMECQLTDLEMDGLREKTDGYSGADVACLCREAALGPIRSISAVEIPHIRADQVRPICCDDFVAALKHVRSSVSPQDLVAYEEWNRQYGSSV
eukprot:m.29765 g.29765  ORF g.29765 m.29765 type:complete len:593 (+) comp31228_c0_seq1:139-1917(+)